MDGSRDALVSVLEALIGTSVGDKGLLEQAFVHRSYLNENPGFPLPSNERLEFLGDAVLGLVTAELLYQRLPHASEGDLTRLRAALVRGETLSRIASKVGLGNHLRLGHGELRSGGTKRQRILAATLEALIGAVFLDLGLETTRRFVDRLVHGELDRVLAENLAKDAKSRLQELAQAELRVTPGYRVVSSEGPEHAKTFNVVVHAGERVLGSGSGHSKQEAEQEAARVALDSWPAA